MSLYWNLFRPHVPVFPSFPEERQVWFCNDENILISCREGNVIHVDKFMFGDFYHLSSTRTCPSLLYDGYHGQYHCEVSVLTHNVSYHNEVIAACEGKTRCDSGLQALAGPALGWCRHDPDSTYALNYETPTDYVALYYYCHPGLSNSRMVQTRSIKHIGIIYVYSTVINCSFHQCRIRYCRLLWRYRRPAIQYDILYIAIHSVNNIPFVWLFEIVWHDLRFNEVRFFLLRILILSRTWWSRQWGYVVNANIWSLLSLYHFLWKLLKPTHRDNSI